MILPIILYSAAIIKAQPNITGKNIAILFVEIDDWRICITALFACPSEEDWIFFPPTGSCYLHSDSKLGWDDARRYCVDRGGDLASVHSADENKFVLNLAPHQENFWIGGYRDGKTKSWRWSDGSLFDFSDWIGGKPYRIDNNGDNKHSHIEIGKVENIGNYKNSIDFTWYYLKAPQA